MKIQYVFAATTLVAVTSAKPHHLHQRAYSQNAVKHNIVYAPAATETQIVYWIDDHAISEDEVREGIANGTLMWGPGNVLSSTDTHVALPTSPPTPNHEEQAADISPGTAVEGVVEVEPVEDHPEEPVDNHPEEPVGDPQPKPEEPTTEAPPNDVTPPDLPVIQQPDTSSNPWGSCSDGTCCKSGRYCSYGCPNPYLKASFPSTQGRHGQTVGGLYCNKDGYLEMADGKIADTLCVPGSKKMGVKVQNNLSQTVSFCRTDYPGTESMTFPVTVGPGQTGFLANPDQQTYFFWQGKRTSAQYYVNKQGVPEDEACTWGTEMGGKGNWAPAVFGTSFDDGPVQQGFSSLKQNELCKQERLGYDITFVGDDVVSACRYKSATNQWCEGDQCWEDPDRGCTAAITHGDLTVILSEG
ncbi:hypothetical protein GGP41_000570 [Bipolaris sorokiniana]|uniref:Glycoside hydrolase family 132 protein n=1 Tax=Cochliobolus sativus TaxID=45130 RepID=A0A8H5ZMJ9_COCSA|nr:hypothetical protein GGP41_000570 [Bipolaris sorokiniana]